MNQRKKRWRDLERWRAERRSGVATYGLSPLAGMVRFFGDIENAANAFVRACANMAQAFATVAIAVSPILAKWYAMKLPGPEQPVTFAELCRDLGTDGASMPGARFTSEGGFSLN